MIDTVVHQQNKIYSVSLQNAHPLTVLWEILAKAYFDQPDSQRKSAAALVAFLATSKILSSSAQPF